MTTTESNKMLVYYNGKVIINNSTQTQKDTHNQPYVAFTREPKKLYAISMTDPDAPRSSSSTPYLHWLVANIHDKFDGNILMNYAGPTPPSGSGTHHYKICLYSQATRINKDKITTRPNFDLSSFESSNNLSRIDCLQFIVEAKK